MMARRWLTRYILRVTVPSSITWLAHTSIRPVGVETPAVVTGAGPTRTFHHVFCATGAGEARGTGAGVPSVCAVVSYATTPIAAWLGCAMVLV